MKSHLSFAAAFLLLTANCGCTTPEEAAFAYDIASKEHLGDIGLTNFLSEPEGDTLF